MWSKWEDDDEHGQEYGCVLRKPTLSQKSGDASQKHKLSTLDVQYKRACLNSSLIVTIRRILLVWMWY